MMQVIPKSHEERIATLERQIVDLQRVVGSPGLVGAPVTAGIAAQQAQNLQSGVSGEQAIRDRIAEAQRLASGSRYMAAVRVLEGI